MTERSSSIRALLLSALLVASAVGGAVVLAGASAAAQDDASVSFEGETYREIAQGDPIREPYTITLSGTEYATVVFTGARNTNTTFWANATVRDTDGDGYVNLSVNTWELGHGTAMEAESGEVVSYSGDELPEDRLLNKSKDAEQNAYDLLLAPGQDPAQVLQSYSGNARLKIVEGETEEIEPVTAPRGSNFQRLSDIYDRPGPFGDTVEGMSAEGDRQIAVGDELLLLPFGGGFYGAAEHAIQVSDGDREAAFQWLLENDHYRFEMKQNASTPKILDVEKAIEEDALQFANGLDYYHVLIGLNTSEAVFQTGGEGEYVRAEAGEVYQVSFQKAGRLPADMDPAAIRTVFLNVTMLEPRTEIEAPTVSLQDGELGGSSTLAPGSNITIYTNAGEEVYSTEVMKIPGGDDTDIESGVELHPWNFTAEFPDTENKDVELAVWSDSYGRIGAFPPDTGVGPEPATTTAGPGETTETTTESGETSTATSGDGGSGGDGGSDGDGGGGSIPGFTASLALVAVIAAALLAFGRK